jgi:hypothetical protein
MKTAIIDGHVVETPARELSDTDAHRITAGLAEQGIRVEPVLDVFHLLHIWALADMSTREEITAIGAFRDATDCRLVWHKAVAR